MEAIKATDTQTWSDEQLVEAILGGDRDLFEEIVNRHSGRVYRAAVAILKDDSEAEDVTQETFLSAYQHLGQFEGRAKFSTWLTRIAVHFALARLSRRARETSISEDEYGYEVLPTREPSAERKASARQLLELVGRALADLPESYRRVLILRHVREFDTSRTAAMLKITEMNVKVRLHRAHNMLRQRCAALAGEALSLQTE